MEQEIEISALSRALRLPEFRVAAAGGEQFAVRAALENPSMIQHYDHVCPPDRGKTVGNDERGAIRNKGFNCGLDRCLRHRVHTRRGFVENDQGRVF